MCERKRRVQRRVIDTEGGNRCMEKHGVAGGRTAGQIYMRMLKGGENNH